MNQTLTDTRAGWHRHRWGRGWVEDTATVAQTAWIDAAAEVADCAVVEGHAWITDNARVSGCAKVCDNATVTGWARVEGNAKVSGNAWLAADTLISDHAQVKDNAWIEGNIWIGEQATVGGNARLTDSVWVSGEALVEGARDDAVAHERRVRALRFDDAERLPVIAGHAGIGDVAAEHVEPVLARPHARERVAQRDRETHCLPPPQRSRRRRQRTMLRASCSISSAVETMRVPAA